MTQPLPPNELTEFWRTADVTFSEAYFTNRKDTQKKVGANYSYSRKPRDSRPVHPSAAERVKEVQEGSVAPAQPVGPVPLSRSTYTHAFFQAPIPQFHVSSGLPMQYRPLNTPPANKSSIPLAALTWVEDYAKGIQAATNVSALTMDFFSSALDERRSLAEIRHEARALLGGMSEAVKASFQLSAQLLANSTLLRREAALKAEGFSAASAPAFVDSAMRSSFSEASIFGPEITSKMLQKARKELPKQPFRPSAAGGRRGFSSGGSAPSGGSSFRRASADTRKPSNYRRGKRQLAFKNAGRIRASSAPGAATPAASKRD